MSPFRRYFHDFSALSNGPSGLSPRPYDIRGHWVNLADLDLDEHTEMIVDYEYFPHDYINCPCRRRVQGVAGHLRGFVVCTALSLPISRLGKEVFRLAVIYQNRVLGRVFVQFGRA